MPRTPILIVGHPSIARKGKRLIATYKLNESPDKVWIKKFRERATVRVFNGIGAVFSDDEVSLELPSTGSLEELTKVVTRFCDGANLDTGRTGK
jgi:hypothetical protein